MGLILLHMDSKKMFNQLFMVEENIVGGYMWKYNDQ
jgi:hypothetical protein